MANFCFRLQKATQSNVFRCCHQQLLANSRLVGRVSRQQSSLFVGCVLRAAFVASALTLTLTAAPNSDCAPIQTWNRICAAVWKILKNQFSMHFIHSQLNSSRTPASCLPTPTSTPLQPPSHTNTLPCMHTHMHTRAHLPPWRPLGATGTEKIPQIHRALSTIVDWHTSNSILTFSWLEFWVNKQRRQHSLAFASI